jgi:hypothetical protein
MKKVLAPVIMAALLIICGLFSGCSGGQANGTASTQAQPQAGKTGAPAAGATAAVATLATPIMLNTYTPFAPSTVTTIPVGSEKIWLDIPIYSGLVITFHQKVTNPNEKFSRQEDRTYKSADEMAKVSAFYKSSMPENGWTELSWKEDQGEINAEYDKNSKKDVCKVNISLEKGDTYIIFKRYIP